jgi:hypothetical protein
MADLAKGALVRHGEFGIGRVEGTGSGPDREVYFPRLEKQALVDADDLEPLSDAEAAAYEMVKLAARELREVFKKSLDLMMNPSEIRRTLKAAKVLSKHLLKEAK